QAQGRFRRTAVTLAIVALGGLIAAAIGAVSDDPVRVSIWVGCALAGGCLLFSISALRVVDITVADYARAVLPEWATAMAVAALVFAADRATLHTLAPPARFLCVGALYAVLF